MYNEIDREDVFNYLVDTFEKIDEVIAVIQVGSGVFGYIDKYSDLDFAIIVDNSSINNIFKRAYEIIKEKYNIVFFDNIEERKLQLFLLDNYLEIDIMYYTLETICTKIGNYKVIFDKSNNVENRIKSSYIECEEKNKITISDINMENVISYIDNELWYNVIHSVISFKRDNIYRCYYELDQIKSYVIELILKRNKKEVQRYRNINELKESELDNIDYLFVYPKTYEELSIYLKKSLITIFNEFNYWKEKENIKFIGNLDYYEKYINFNE